eukprot:XP_016659335.1 PREDICTED: uncharacterized protein LOC107883584 [Acyrthosiphon pisum]
MADGIKFYNSKKYSGFTECEDTIKFTLKMNNLFDALNRKFPAEGIKSNSPDLEVLRDASNWLNSWERNLEQNLITDNDFLTKQTSEGLRMTIQSTIDLSNFFLNECGFAYVLSNKFNQDRLEKFFGIIRQTAGPNDHPSTPTFLQLYRMLSVYSIIKPPKSGNCSILEENCPLISLADIKSIIHDQNNSIERNNKIKKLKAKIDGIVEEGCWTFDDVFSEHNYSDLDSSVFECIVYFLAG